MIDLDSVRADTPSCQHGIHFNNAGSAPMPTPVHETVLRHLERERVVGGYQAEAEAAEGLQSFYQNFATLLNAESDEIAFVENATRAWDMIFYALPLQAGNRVLTHGSEYVSNYLAMLQTANRRQIEIDVVPSDTSGQIDVQAMENMITAETRVVAITHVPTQGGLVNPAAAVGEVANRHGLFYLLDACQSAGQMPLDVQAIGCTALSGTGRKFLRGPRGTGFLYVRRSALESLLPPFIDLRSANWQSAEQYQWSDGARRFENWECHVAGKFGLARAVQYAMDIGLENIEKHVIALAESLRTNLSALDGVTVHDLGQSKCAIVTFDKRGCKPATMASKLIAQNIFASVSSRDSAQLDLGVRNIDSLLRASVHYYNSEEEVDRFCEAVKAI